MGHLMDSAKTLWGLVVNPPETVIQAVYSYGNDLVACVTSCTLELGQKLVDVAKGIL